MCPLGLARVLGLSSVLIIIGYGRPGKFCGVPYYDLPLSITRLRAIMQFRMGSHGLPIEQGRFAGLASPATFAGARYAVLCLLVMSATISLSALSFTWLGHSTHLYFMTLRIPCGVWSGTRIRRLSASFWRSYFIGLRR